MPKKPLSNKLDKKFNPKIYIIAAAVAILILYLYRLGSLTNGISINEHGYILPSVNSFNSLYNNPLNLPLETLRFIFFHLTNHVGQTLIRIPNIIIGFITSICFAVLLYLWHGKRTAIFGTILFSISAWSLHVSRLTSNSVDYLFGITLILLTAAILNKHYKNPYYYVLVNLTYSILIFIPGMVWLIALVTFRNKKELALGYRLQKTDKKASILYKISTFIWIPLLILGFINKPNSILTWLGLPTKIPKAGDIITNFINVFVHIFIHGPLNPEIWLSRAPLLDIFCLSSLVVGIIFYVGHINASRSKLLFYSFAIGTALITLGGPLDLSVLMPIIYVFIAAGIAYLLHRWLHVFPFNPIARGLGYTLIALAVFMSSIYSLRSYYVAWPHNKLTYTTFEVKQ